MRNDNQGSPLSDTRDIGIDDRLAVGIERARRFVENQNAWVDDERARNRQTLSLPTRQVWRALIDIGFIAARQPLDKLLRAGQPRSANDFVKGRIDLSGGDIFADRPAEQKIFLQHHAETAAQMIDVIFTRFDTIDLDQSFVIGVKPLQQVA